LRSKSSKTGSVLAPIFGANTQKSLHSVLLPIDTRHVLKFRKDPFRGVDGIDWKTSNICKTDAVAM